MKTLRFLGIALVATLVMAGFTACSSDDDNNDGGTSSEELLGRWICTSSTFTPNEDGRDADNYYWREDRGEYKYGYGLAVGDGFKLLSGNKCFILDADDDTAANPTEAQWDSEDGETWTVSGNTLSIIESDEDRFIGTYEISGNKLTFTYKTQDWNGDSHTMTGEYPKTYVSVFEKK